MLARLHIIHRLPLVLVSLGAIAACGSSSGSPGGATSGATGGSAGSAGSAGTAGSTSTTGASSTGAGGAAASSSTSGVSSSSASSSSVSSSGGYSCEVKSTLLHECTLYEGLAPSDLATEMTMCEELDGTSGTSCPTAGAIGTCTSDGVGQETWYSDGQTTAAEAETSCDDADGTWTPG